MGPLSCDMYGLGGTDNAVRKWFMAYNTVNRNIGYVSFRRRGDDDDDDQISEDSSEFENRPSSREDLLPSSGKQ